MPNQTPVHPHFDRPPVVEVVCGVQFRSVVGMHAPLLGRLWSKFEDDFPRVHTMPLLMPNFQEGGEITLDLGDVPPLPRIWFIGKDDKSLIQVQQDRLIYNWKRNEGEERYPGFTAIIGKFQEILGNFVAFLEENELGDLNIDALELAYVDHIKKEGGWKSAEGIGYFFPDFSWRGGERFLSAPVGVDLRCEHKLPAGIGSLKTRIQNVRPTSDNPEPALRLHMSVVGAPTEITEDGKQIWEWYGEANKWITQAFSDITSDEAQTKEWGKR